MATAGELVVLIAAKDEASKALDGIGQKLGGLGKLAGVALAGVAAAGAGFTAAIVGSVGAAMDFESAMSAVGAVAGASSSELAALSQTALQLGQDTTLAGVSASDAAKAMAELASGGISVADIMGGAARGALLLASAGGIDVARAAEIAAAALNNFGLAGSQTGHVADLFAAAANSSAVTVSDLGESMKYIGPIANSMGLSIEEVTAALAELGDQGIKGSQAGTSLRSILSSLAKPSKQASGLIKELGLEFFDVSGHMKSLAGISEQLKTHLSGLTDQQRANALVTLFGNEALSAATVLYGEGADGIAKYLDQVNVAGSAADNGAKRNDNLKGSIEQLKSSWETLSIVLGTAFIPVVRRVVDGAAGLINTIIGLKDTIGPAVAAILQGFKTGDFNNAFGPILAVIDKVFGEGTSGKVALFVSNVLTFVQNLRNGIVSFAGGIASGFGAVLGAIASLVTGQTTLAQFIGGMEIFVTTVLGNLGKLATQAAPYLGMFLSAIGTFIAAAVPQIVAQMLVWATAFTGWITTTAIPYLQTNLPLWLAALSTWVTGTALPAIGAFVGQIGAAFGGWITGTAIPYLTTNLPLWLTAIQGWITGTALPAITTAMQALGTAFGDWVATSAVPWVQANLPGWIAAVTGWINSTALPAITSAVQGLAGALVSWIKGDGAKAELDKWKDVIIAGLADVLVLLTSAVGILGPKLVEWIKSEETRTKFGELAAAVGDGLADILNALNDFSANAGVAFRQWIDTAGPLWLHDWDELGRVAKEGMQRIITDLIPGIYHMSQEMNKWAETVLPKWLTDWGELWRVVDTNLAKISATVDTFESNLGTAVGTWINTAGPKWLHDWDSLGEAVSSSIEKVTGLVATLPGRISGALGDLSGLLVNAGVQIIEGLLLGIQSRFGAVQALLGDLTNMLPSWKGPPEKDARLLFESGQLIIKGLIDGIDDKQLDLEKKLTDVTNSIFTTIKNGLDALKALSSFDFGKNTPSAGQIGGITAFIANMTAIIGEVAAQFSEKTLKAAGDFADAAGKVVNLIGNGVKGLMALTDFVPPALSSILAFGKSLRSLLADLSLLAEIMTQEATDQAAAFAEGAGKVVAILGSGVSGFTALQNFVSPPLSAVLAFGKSLRSLIADISLLAEIMTQEAVNQAAAFAEGAGKVVGILGTGVAGFTALIDYVAPPVSAILAFGKSLRSIIADLSLLSEIMTQDAVDQAAKFAEGAGKVIGIIGSGVEGFTKLLDFTAPSQQAIDNFVYAVFEAVRKIAEMASQMSDEGIKLAGEFGTAAGNVLGALKTGLDVFTGLAKLVVPSAKAIDDFAIAVVYAVRKIGDLADQFGKDGIERATKFGASVQTVFGSLKSSMDILTNLEKFKDVAEKAFDSLQKGLQAAIDLAQGMVNQSKDMVLLSEEYAANMLKAATNFAKGQSLGGSGEEIGKRLGEGVASGARTALESHSPSQVMAAIGKDVVDGLVQGMSDAQQDAAKKAADVASAVAKAITDTLGAATALGKLDVATLPGAGQITGILAFTRALVAEMAAASTMLNEDATKSTNLFADAASKVAGAVSAGVAALTAIGTFVAPADRAIFDFGKSLRVAVMDLNALAEEIAPAIVEAAATFSEGATKALGIFGSGVAGLASLLGFTYTKQLEAGIYAFGKSVRVIVADFNYLAEELGTGLAEAAGKFAEGSGKVLALLSAGKNFGDLLGFTFTEELKAGIYAFGKAVSAIVRDFNYMAEQYGTDLADAAGKWADGAGKVVGIVNGSLAAFKSLEGEFVVPAQSAVDRLVAGVAAITVAFAGMAKQIGTEVADLAGKFADGAGKAVGVVAQAVSGFVGLATFVTPGRAAVDGLIATIRYIVQRFGEMAATMATDGIEQTGKFGEATQAVLGGVKAAIDTFIALDQAVVPRTGDLSDLVVAVQGVTRNMAAAAAALGDDAIKDATAFGTAANGIFTALKAGLDLFTQIDKPGGWPTTDWLQPLIELMSGMLSRGGALLSQAQQLKAVADQFSATMAGAYAGFATGLGGGGLTLTGNVGGSGLIGGGGGTTIINNTFTGNTFLSKDTATQQAVAGIVTATQGRTIGYSTSG